MPRKSKEVIITPKLFKDTERTTLFADMLVDVWRKKKFALLSPEAGVGKTFVTIHAVGNLPAGKNAHFLIFGPKAKKLDHSWEASIMGYNQVKDTEMTYMVETHNYMRDHTAEVLENIQQHKNAGQPIVIVIDEVHLIKNPTSKAAKAFKKLIDNPNVDITVGLSATPYSNSYIDTTGYLVFNNYYRNKTDFNTQQVKMFNEYKAPIVKNDLGEIDRNMFKDPDYIDKCISEFNVNKKLDKNPLPPASFEERLISLNDDKTIKYIHPAFEEFEDVPERTQRGNYNAVKNKYYRDGYYESAAAAISVQRNMISDILQRTTAMIKILKEIRESNDPHPVLIFYLTNFELNSIENALKHATNEIGETHVHIVNGKHKDLEDVTDPNTVVLIQYKAGGAAIEFPHAFSSIYYMPTYSYQDYVQTLGRNRRSGMAHPVKYYKIIARNTIDDYIWHNVLENKKDFITSSMENMLAISEDIPKLKTI